MSLFVSREESKHTHTHTHTCHFVVIEVEWLREVIGGPIKHWCCRCMGDWQMWVRFLCVHPSSATSGWWQVHVVRGGRCPPDKPVVTFLLDLSSQVITLSLFLWGGCYMCGGCADHAYTHVQDQVIGDIRAFLLACYKSVCKKKCSVWEQQAKNLDRTILSSARDGRIPFGVSEGRAVCTLSVKQSQGTRIIDYCLYNRNILQERNTSSSWPTETVGIGREGKETQLEFGCIQFWRQKHGDKTVCKKGNTSVDFLAPRVQMHWNLVS